MSSKKKQDTYKYKMTFVMPVYNAEAYLHETLDCIIGQTLGFKDNIQIVIVNDGSKDDSGKVAKRYQKKHPKNIIYIEQENAGVSAARNAGIEKVEGKYISFLDSDDLLSADTAQSVYDFFEEHYSEIDLVTIQLRFFGVKTGSHPLNYKYKKDEVVYTQDKYTYSQLSGGSAFVKTDAVKSVLKFDTKIKRSEDFKFLTQLILEKQAYGVLKKPIYWYRKAEAMTSAIDQSIHSRDWYFDTPKQAYLYLLKYSKEKFGSVPKYVQYAVAYDLQWRITQGSQSILSHKDVDRYKKLLTEILQYVDDDIIMQQRQIRAEHKHKLLSMKHGRDVKNTADVAGKKFYIGSTLIYDYDWPLTTTITDLRFTSEDTVRIEGYLQGLLMKGARLGFKVGSRFYPVELVERRIREKYFLGELIDDGSSFVVEIPIKPGMKIIPAVKVGNIQKETGLSANYISRLVRVAGRSYRALGDYLICWHGTNSLAFIPRKPMMHLKKEIIYHISLLRGVYFFRRLKRRVVNFLRNQKKPSVKLNDGNQPSAVNKPRPKQNTYSAFSSIVWHVEYVTLRAAYYITKPYLSGRKRIWLISDRLDAAGDNGEAFFRFMSSQPDRGIKRYFVIKKSSPDYDRMKEYGKVLDYDSWKYKLYFLHADKVISAHADDFVINAFGSKIRFFVSLLTFDFVFLQHGVIVNDLSGWLNKYHKSIDLFVTSAHKEKDSIDIYKYGYSDKSVILTGMPRYDLLESEPKNKVILAPTWRLSLAGKQNPANNLRDYNPEFKSSDYYNFYNDLLHSEKVINALEKYDYTLEFYLHPALSSQLKDFSSIHPRVVIKSYPYDYKTVFREGSLLVTDFSSVFFDFAYLNKPVVFAQFDHEEFFKKQIYDKGYFDYETDGFGEVCYDLTSTEETVVSYLKNGCSMKEKYAKRKSDFFAWHDKNNSQRVYQAILNLDDDSIELAISTNKSYRANRLRNQSCRPIKTFWFLEDWESGNISNPLWINFGDDLTRYITRALWGIKVQAAKPEDAELVGVGSVLQMLSRHAPESLIHVWGSGFISEGKSTIPESYKVHALRGKNTLARYRGKNKVVLGDPGLLANLVFKRSKKRTGKIGLIYHYVDEDSEVFLSRANDDRFLLIDPRQTPDKVVLDITSCDVVFSSAMHGLIVADSFSIPNFWMPVSDKVIGGEYKFIDYYSATGREFTRIEPEILDNSDAINSLVDSYVPIKNLKEIQEQLIDSFPFKEGKK